MIVFLVGFAIVGGLLLALALLRGRQTEQRDTLPSPMLDTSPPELDLTDVAEAISRGYVERTGSPTMDAINRASVELVSRK